MKKGALIVCASIAFMEDSVLMNKLIEVFDQQNIRFTFWGWNRGREKKEKMYPVKHLWHGGGFSNKSLFLHYPLWIINIFLNSLISLKKNDIVLAVALDVALPVYLASKIKGFKYIFYDPDNFSLTYNLKGIFKKIIDGIERVVARKSIHHILPIESRYEYNDDNIVIFPNFPLDSELKKARKILSGNLIEDIDLSKIKSESRLKIYINGRMVPRRGSEWLARVFEKLDPNKFLILVAGDIYCNVLTETLNNLSNVIKFPRLLNFQALSLYYISDLVLAFYDPILPINRKAAPNKWWDCVATNTPFISNSEIETLKPFKEKNACFTVDYNDFDQLFSLLNSLSNDRKKINDIKQELLHFSIQSWEEKMDLFLETIRKNIA